MSVSQQKTKLEKKAKTGKEWAWFFYQELGYRICDNEEDERSLKKVMDKLLEDAQKEIDNWIDAYNKLNDSYQNERLELKQKLQPLSEKEFQDIMADFAVKERLSKGKCDEYTLSCYRSGARDQGNKDYRFLQSMELVVLRKDVLELLK